jgi:hypothetical protein
MASHAGVQDRDGRTGTRRSLLGKLSVAEKY